jgi:RNA polymerase sigma factor (sigma-70 family)
MERAIPGVTDIMKEQANREKLADVFSGEYHKLVGYARQWLKESSVYDAEDVVQDIIVSMFERTDVLMPVRNLTAYIYRSIYNRIMDLLRKKENTVPLSAEPFGDGDERTLEDIIRDMKPDISDELEQKEIARRLYEAMETLGDDEKAVIIETELEGSTFQELSEEWDIPVGTLLSKKSRALQKVREKLTNK